ncbi:Rpn family recombination-promoting nuclease/putative transposase [Lederbergia sp. NSJ-179]|uniref:Rpn family recombination-promoting nuclease/putative transposase n=1 Tax=Lederbergia sp. NSJ-179 TaxID=2931402 RepID=UPI001FD60EE2|nr:Rpn family recombination-promoting nuclease/putative transposase [Lederbergia sp. NSJ-179]MCJ7840100.1 Rpn family recombination-promoting nuclease/putative transposase [Lederbergia sp. NSJ-179]
MAKQFYEGTTVYTALIHEDSTDYNKRQTNPELLKRIPLGKLMDLKIDYAFKQLFGSEKNKHLTFVFLNAFLQKAGRGKIKDITFLNTEVGREYADDKLSRVDILVVTEHGERINVEIQFSNKYNMINRSLFYWSRLYTETLKKNMDYDKLRPVISINILNYNIFDQTDRYHTMYHLYEDREKFKLTNTMEFHYIEMPKLLKDWKEDRLDPWNDLLVRWLLLLGIVDHRNGKVYEDIYKELEVIAMEDKTLYSAFEGWQELSMTEEEVRAYESRLKQILDEEAYRTKMDKWEQKNRKAEERNRKAEERNRKAEERNRKVAERNREVAERNRKNEQRNQEKEQVLEQREKVITQKLKEAQQRESEAKREVAIRLLKASINMDVVVESTGLQREQIIELQRELNK